MCDHSHRGWNQQHSLIFLYGSVPLLFLLLWPQPLCVGKSLMVIDNYSGSQTWILIRITWRAFQSTECWVPPPELLMG